VDAGVALDSVWSSADGTFRFLASPSMRVFVTAHHADFAPASSDIVTTPADGAASVLLLVMKDGTALDGEVVDRAGRPVVSAQVRLRLEGGGPFTNRASLTGPDGRFSFTGLTAASATISAATESATSRDYVLALHIGQRQSLRIELDREGTISGSVVTARGVAAAGAIVRAQPLSTATDRSTPVPVLSSADGGFTLRGLAPGRYRLTAAPTFAAGASRTGTIEARTGDVGVRVQLPASASLSALVKSATGEMPKLARVFVDLAPRGEAENGRIQIDGLEPGEHGLYVEAPGAGATKVERFVLAADENVDLGTLVLSGGRTVSGRVLTEDGSPVAGAEVSIGTLVIDGGGVNDDLIGVGQQKQVTAEDGAFRFQGVESTASTLVARHPSRGRSAAQTVPAGTADITRELVLSGKTTLAGRVLRAGQPLSRAVVITYPVGNDAARTLRTVDEQGRFEFDGLTEGKYLLMGGVVGGNRELDVQVMTVKITNGERHQQDISLSAQGVELTVVLPERVGAAGAQVYMLDGAVGAQDGAALQASVSEVSEGSIRMAHLPRGATTVFRNVAPGAHSVCALLLGTSNGGAVGRDLVGAMPQRLPVTCQTIAVGGAAQTLTIGGV
jgi:hypothetical protein